MAVNTTEIEAIYNKFMDTTPGNEGLVLKSIQAEFSSQRIKGAEYANVFLSAIQTAMQLAVQTVQQQEKIDAEVALTESQTKVSDNKIKLDLLGTQVSAWSTTYNSGKYDTTPDILANVSIENLYDELKDA